VRSLRSPVRVGPPGGDTPFVRGGPAMGEHTDAVLRGLGYDDERLTALRAAGAFGTPEEP
jgi:crotonobetainyl-CoA:carnitine CoA-transferase CaiB-like acyl-CoA transferase